MIDLYDRNPTSTDHKVDVDEAWIRFGPESDRGRLPAHSRGYLKVGKMPKFERQDDRHLESYGLVSTAFNRMEDTGAEAWVRFGIEPEPAILAPRWGAYLKVGKMPKFERQDDLQI